VVQTYRADDMIFCQKFVVVQYFLRIYRFTYWKLVIRYFHNFIAFEHPCWVTTNAETINLRVLGINDILHYSRVFTFDDSAVGADSLFYTSVLLMAVDKFAGARVFRGCAVNTEVKFTAIVWVRKISAGRANEIGLMRNSNAFIASRVAAFTIVAGRSVGIQVSAVYITGMVVVSGRKPDADRFSSTVVAGVLSAFSFTAECFHLFNDDRNTNVCC